MRNLFTTSILSLLSIGSFAQTTLTRQNNALIAGESCTYQEIQFVEPGNKGPNQLWDFSKIQFTEKNLVNSVKPALTPKIEGITNYNLSLQDADGYNFFLNSSDFKLEELGYVNIEKKMTLVYSDAVLKMKYPFSYGDQYTDPFAGVAYFDQKNKIELTGDYTLTADAYGTLITPNAIFKNVMRVKAEKKGIQINSCGEVKTSITKYSWYAEGYRYPVFNISIIETSHNNKVTPEVTKTASVYIPQITNNPIEQVFSSGPINKITTTADVSVVLFPNPFSEKISYSYVLEKQVPVTITMFDVTGKYSEVIANNEIQAEGIHRGEIGGLNNNLAAGVYYLRFNFGGQVLVKKFVKLEIQ